MGILDMTPRDKLTKARVSLNRSHPFFGRFTMLLKFEECKEIGTIGITQNGLVLYNPEWIDKLPVKEMKGLLCHEVMHCVLKHLERLHSRDAKIYNVANDIVVNYMIKTNGLDIPACGCNADGLTKWTMPLQDGKELIVDNIDKRTSESIYIQIRNALGTQKGNGQGTGKAGEGQPMPKGFDEHIYSDSKEGQKMKREKKNKGLEHRNGDFWNNKLVENAMACKMQGNSPKGFDILLKNLLSPTLSWNRILQKFIRDKIPFDFTWRKPSKKTYGLNLETILPSTMREGMNLLLLIDTSGSINVKDLEKVFGEINGIVKTIHGLDMQVMYHDTRVYEGSTLKNPSSADITRELHKVKGGGGTNHIPAFEYIEKKYRDLDVIISFTDGYSSFPSKCKIPTIFCIQKDGLSKKDAEKQITFGKIIKIED